MNFDSLLFLLPKCIFNLQFKTAMQLSVEYLNGLYFSNIINCSFVCLIDSQLKLGCDMILTI